MLPRQHQLNQREIAKLDIADRDLKTLSQTLDNYEQKHSLRSKHGLWRSSRRMPTSYADMTIYLRLPSGQLKNMYGRSATRFDVSRLPSPKPPTITPAQASHASELARLSLCASRDDARQLRRTISTVFMRVFTWISSSITSGSIGSTAYAGERWP